MTNDGAQQLQLLGKRLKQLAAYQNTLPSESVGLTGRSLRAQLLAGIRAGAKPAVEATRQAARDQLPKHGGLNEYVATSGIVTSTRLTGPRVGVRIGVRKGSQFHRAYGANKGTIRHPVFARKDRIRQRWKWVDQQVTPGWFDQTLEKATPAITAVVTKTCQAIAEEVTRRGV